MDPFDFIPAAPPSLPGERELRTPAEQAAAVVGFAVLPAVNVLLVLLAGLAPHTTIVLVVLPPASAVLAYLVSRRLSVSAGRSLLVGFSCTVACFVCNLAALLLAALGSFYSTF